MSLSRTAISVLCSMLLFWTALVPRSHGYAIGHSKYGRVENFPYQVMLIGKKFWGKRTLCGGTLLDARWVLTASHCIPGVTYFDVYLGARSLDDTVASGRLVLRSNKFVTHEQFDPQTAANDIALVKLPQDVAFSERIQPASLPQRRHRNDHFTGALVVATGWGAADETKNSDPLQYTELRVISNEECAEEYEVVNEGVLCAKGMKQETVCSGDSGGPLVLKGTQMVVGVTSFGPADGCRPSAPGGFSRITHYLDWIDSKIGPRQANVDKVDRENIV